MPPSSLLPDHLTTHEVTMVNLNISTSIYRTAPYYVSEAENIALHQYQALNRTVCDHEYLTNEVQICSGACDSATLAFDTLVASYADATTIFEALSRKYAFIATERTAEFPSTPG